MDLTGSIVVQRPRQEVFDYVSDYANDPEWREGVLVMRADGPIASGATTHEELVFLGSRYVTTGTVTEKSDRRLAFRGENASVRSEGFREVITEDGATRITYHLRLEPRGLLALFAPILRLLYARRIEGDMVRLKARLEGDASVEGLTRAVRPA